MDANSLQGSTAQVLAPDGSTITANVQSITPTGTADALGDATEVSVACQITPPGGSWSTAPSGLYTVLLGGSPVSDLASNDAPTGPIGSFNVAVDHLAVTTQPPNEVQIGNPFEVVVVRTEWLAWEGGIVRRMALEIYEERAFERLPVLADALEDAGCAHDGLLSHCRVGRAHRLGCWALDKLLGKQ